jgi:hypothetical protein
MEDESPRAAKLRAAVRAARQAPASTVRDHNRLKNVVRRELDYLAGTESGRALLVSLASSDPDLGVRITCANTVMAWAPSVARDALEQIVREAGAEIARPMTMQVAVKAPWGYASTAALSLLNLNRPSPDHRTEPVSGIESSPPVPSSRLDAAERLYGLAMNGGLEHAFDVAGGDFADACLALDAVGATDASEVFREAHDLLEQSQRHEGIEQALGALNARLLNTSVMDFLEQANEK